MRLTSLYLVIMMFLVVSCQKQKTSEQKVQPPLGIKVEKVSRKDLADTISIYGMIKLRQEAFLASQFDGRITEFNLIRGDQVNTGQQIAIIIPPQREALIQTISGMSEEQKNILEQEIKEIPLLSPIKGTILEVMQHVGDVVQQGESIVHIANLSILDVYGDLPVIYLPRVKQLKTLRLEFIDFPHSPIYLPISAFDGQVDAKKQTIQIRLALSNPNQEFRPGMMVRLEFPEKVHQNTLVISRSALLEEEGIYSVFVFKDDHVEKRIVQIGIKHDDVVEITSGLNEGEMVANQKTYSLTDGMNVQIQ